MGSTHRRCGTRIKEVGSVVGPDPRDHVMIRASCGRHFTRMGLCVRLVSAPMYRSLLNLARTEDKSPAVMPEQANSSIVLVIPPARRYGMGWGGAEVDMFRHRSLV